MAVDFTSGERRGLIALLALLAAVLCFCLIVRMCDTSGQHEAVKFQAETSKADTVTTQSDDTTATYYSIQSRRTGKSKNRKTKLQRPDGPQRSFLDEPVE